MESEIKLSLSKTGKSYVIVDNNKRLYCQSEVVNAFISNNFKPFEVKLANASSPKEYNIDRQNIYARVISGMDFMSNDELETLEEEMRSARADFIDKHKD